MSLHIWKFVTRILAYISSACHTRPSSAKCQARPIFYRPIAAALAFKLSIVSNKWGQHISKSWITFKRMKHLNSIYYNSRKGSLHSPPARPLFFRKTNQFIFKVPHTDQWQLFDILSINSKATPLTLNLAFIFLLQLIYPDDRTTSNCTQ